MTAWIQNLMDTLGYAGIFLLMILENLFPPLPSEFIMPAAGFAAARGDLTLVGVVLAGTLGSVVGTLPLYYLGKSFGEVRVAHWADRHGKWLTVSGEDVRKADAWFDKHGREAVLFGRLVPGIRSLLSLPAGVSGMSLPRFLIYTTLGSGLWASALGLAGYLLGDRYEEVEHIVSPAGKILLGLMVVGGVALWLKRKRGQEQAALRAQAQPSPDWTPDQG